MKVSIISVGTEILFGQITNTNSVFLSQQLNLLGFDVLYHHTVGDNDGRLSEIIKNSFENCDIVITTGGLGPTEDDMTKETICKFFNDKLVAHKPSLDALERLAKMRKYGKMTENNYKQALMPSRAIVFDNDKGTAPGFVLEHKNKYAIAMPGPPREMVRMFQQKVKPFLKQFQNETICYRTLRFFGKGESSLETEILDLIDNQTDPTIATYAKEGECSIRIASKRKTEKEAYRAIDEIVSEIKNRLSEYIFSYDNEELVDVVGKKLIDNNITISCCESCTGGMFAGTLTSVSGISKVFDRGLTTYTEKAKIQELGVSPVTIEEKTVYSSEVAMEMVEGLHRKTGSDVCISITGIAGPEGGRDDFPVGSAYIGFRYKEKSSVTRINGRNIDRNWNRKYMVLWMLNIINKNI